MDTADLSESATSLWVNDIGLDSRALLCDKKRQHKSMTNGNVRLATAEEAAHPTLLCERKIQCPRDEALHLGVTALDTLLEQAEGPDPSPISRLALGALPRRHKVKPWVAEFGTYWQVFADPQKPNDPDKLLTTLPKGTKPVSRHVVKGGDLQAARQAARQDATVVFLNVDDNSTLGCHPRSLEQQLDPQVKRMINVSFVTEPSIVAKKRADFFTEYVRLASELSSQVEELMGKMPNMFWNWWSSSVWFLCIADDGEHETPQKFAGRKHPRMAVRSPMDGAVSMMGFNASPFGAVGSMAGFLRVSLAVWLIGLVVLRAALQLCWTVLPDDHIVLGREELPNIPSYIPSRSFVTLLDLLGLTFAKGGKRHMPFNHKFKLLGLEVNLEGRKGNPVTIGCIKARRSELAAKINDILAEAWLDAKKAERQETPGCVNSGQPSPSRRQSFGSHSGCNRPTPWKTPGHPCRWSLQSQLLNWKCGELDNVPSRSLPVFFSDVAPEDSTAELSKSSFNTIRELGLMPVSIAHLEWGTLAVCYINHESARMALVKREWRYAVLPPTASVTSSA